METKNIRPPIITLMGHVDHGKTTLLDAIRKSDVASREHGGITQHIGAYQITHEGKQISFIDTPGHAAFEQMRSRGAEAADIVILVVAVNDGVKPQTVEAIKHIQRAKRPIIVAATKVDLENINLDKVKKELQGQNILIEEYGGDVPFIPVCALKNKGINELLEMIQLVWQLNPEASLPNAPLEALVIESFLDKNRGPITTVIVKKGTLAVGQKIFFDSEAATVKALIDDKNQQIVKAGPSKPAEVLGFKHALEVGSIIRANNVANLKEEQKSASLEEIIAKTQEVKDNFKIIIKADVKGSLEAVKENLPAKVLIVSSGVGEINASDVSLAKVANAPILAFNVRVPRSVKSQAEREGIIIREYKVIYELLNDIDAVVESFKVAQVEARITGRAKITNIFNIDGSRIAGAQVSSGKIKVGDTVIVKNKEGRYETKIASLKKFKKEVDSVSSGQECGIGLAGEVDFVEGDIIESLG